MKRTPGDGNGHRAADPGPHLPPAPGNGRAPAAVPAEPADPGVAVDLTALLLKGWVRSPDMAVTGSVDDDPTTRWYTFADETGFTQVGSLPAGPEVALLVRTPAARQPAWHVLLRDYLHVDGFSAAVGESAGAVLFVKVTAEGRTSYVAWCFGCGSAWITRKVASPRFGLLAALNAAARSADAAADGVGVVGATVAARGGNLKRASLTATVPAPSGAMPRIDTMADVLTAARVRTGHETLGKVSAGRSLQFPDVIGSVAQFSELSALSAGLAAGRDYRAMEGWIDDTIPEEDQDVIDKVLDHVWNGADDQGNAIDVDIAWWEDVREDRSDTPVYYWRPEGERRERNNPSRRVTLTWPAVKSVLKHRMGPARPGHEVLATDLRFFSADDEQLGRCAVVDLLTAEVTLDSTTYVLVDGEVCRVDAKFLAALDRDLAEHLAPATLEPYQPGEREDHYNERAAKAAGFLLLDKTTIHPPGQTKLEPCDLLGTDGTLYHVKRHTSATGTSHLVIQAVASATTLLHEKESRGKLSALIDSNAWDHNAKERVKDDLQAMAGTAHRLPVTLAIVGEWRQPTIKNLSLLSRMALRTGIQRLSDIGYQTSLMLIDLGQPK
jgi:uncharacterized protein (TIGR04141 family)